MKKALMKCFSIVVVLSFVICMIPHIGIETTATEVSPFVATEDLPENIRYLLGLDFAEAQPIDTSGVATLATTRIQQEQSAQLQVLNTDDLNTIRMENSNGDGKALVFGVPIRYENKNGELEFIDTSMKEIGLFASLLNGYKYQNSANKTTFRFAQEPDKGI